MPLDLPRLLDVVYDAVLVCLSCNFGSLLPALPLTGAADLFWLSWDEATLYPYGILFSVNLTSVVVFSCTVTTVNLILILLISNLLTPSN